MYEDRLQRHVQFEVIELPPSKQKDAEKQKEEESQRLLDAAVKLDAVLWVLDEKGKAMTSPQFAQALDQLTDAGRSIVFILGGSYGLTDAVREAADVSLKLSDMVMPHELCRVVFLEQLYRAGEIQRGSGYHH